MRSLALDTNILLLFVVGRTDREYIRHHKRLGAYTAQDYDVVTTALTKADEILTTPNCLTEASNLCSYGVKDPLRSRINQTLAHFAAIAREHYAVSAEIVRKPEYGWLGLADAAWLEALDRGGVLISDDVNLCGAVLAHGLEALDFEQLRSELGGL